MMVIECEQCDGDGWVAGQRCPCREEDDEAELRRRKMGIVPNPDEILKHGDLIRIRRAYSNDEWCVGVVERASLNGESVLMRVIEGALRPEGGGIITGIIAIVCNLEKGTARELLTDTELEVARRE